MSATIGELTDINHHDPDDLLVYVNGDRCWSDTVHDWVAPQLATAWTWRERHTLFYVGPDGWGGQIHSGPVDGGHWALWCEMTHDVHDGGVEDFDAWNEGFVVTLTYECSQSGQVHTGTHIDGDWNCADCGLDLRPLAKDVIRDTDPDDLDSLLPPRYRRWR